VGGFRIGSTNRCSHPAESIVDVIRVNTQQRIAAMSTRLSVLTAAVTLIAIQQQHLITVGRCT
jgi:hypothetical protein